MYVGILIKGYFWSVIRNEEIRNEEIRNEEIREEEI